MKSVIITCALALALALPGIASADGYDTCCELCWPDGSWKKSCSNFHWEGCDGDNTCKILVAYCKYGPDNNDYKENRLSCDFIKSCNWRLTNRNGNAVCE